METTISNHPTWGKIRGLTLKHERSKLKVFLAGIKTYIIK